VTKSITMIDQSTFLLDFTLFSRTKIKLLTQLAKQLQTGTRPLVVCTPNPEQIVQSISNKGFGHNLRTADVLVPDGVGLVWASRLLSRRTQQLPLTERIAGSDLVSEILTSTVFSGTALVVGGREYAGRTLQTAARKFVVGDAPLFWTAGYDDIEKQSPAEEQELVELLKRLRPSIVFVAFGAPQQEEWIFKHKQLLDSVGVRLVMSVGGAFDMLLGLVPRAPIWMQNFGLEWLFRLVQQPWRWRRQLRLLQFIAVVTKEFIRPRSRRPSQA